MTEVAFWLQIVSSHEKQRLWNELYSLHKQIQLKHINLLIISEIPNSDCTIRRRGVKQVWIFYGNMQRSAGYLMTFQIKQILSALIEMKYFDDSRFIANCHDFIRKWESIIKGTIVPFWNLIVDVQTIEVLLTVFRNFVNVGLIAVP